MAAASTTNEGTDGPGRTVATIVVTYNAADVIARCLDSLAASEVATQVIVVDNGSRDETVSVVRSRYPAVELIEAGRNLGFPGGCDLGLAAAVAAQARYVFFLNPDAYVAQDCIGLLVEALEQDPTLAIVSPLLVDHATRTVRFAGAALDLEHLDFAVRGWGRPVDEIAAGTAYTGRPTGAAMMARREAIADVGPLDASYFLYWEEAEWARRMTRSGYRIGFVREAIAVHESSHTTGGAGSRVFEYYFARNLLRLVRDAARRGRLSTSVRLVPELGRRVTDRLRARDGRAAARTTAWIAVAYLDFWRGRTGARASLHPSS